MSDLDEVISEFLVECHESLDQLDSDFIALEDDPKDRDRLASIFRTVHTIKGTSGFLAFPKLERVAHVGENLLVPLRDGVIELNHDMASSLLGMVDAIRDILNHIEEGGVEGEQEYGELIATLEAMLSENIGGPAAPKEAEAVEPPETTQEQTTEEAANASDESSDEPTDKEEPEPAVETVSKTEDNVSNDAAPPENPVPPTAAATKQSPAVSEKKESSERSHKSVADSSVRIDVGLLDKLMNLVGELVLARNQILQFGETSGEPGMIAASGRLNLITTELQEGVMKTRMQPIRNAWNKLPRVVRDLSSSCGKSVDVVMEGADTELDKTILEAIKDPLTHIVRNSVDHGIESKDVRVERGKPAQGTLQLRAFHEGGQVNIEICDDGGGIDPERVRAKAVEKGVVTEGQANKMADRELINLILLPGFSTAEKVTNVSGRGVGMDVVKTNIERIGGTLDIQSVLGEGTTLRIKIPLTLAIVPALIISSGESQYAIPQVNLLELVKLSGEQSKEIEFIHESPVYRLRGDLLPLIYLDEQLQLRPKRGRHEHDEAANLVVLKAEDRSFGLVVDSITDTQEIVVKPLGVHLKGIGSYAGATIMGDGKVALILDAIGLAQRGNILTKQHDHEIARRQAGQNHEQGEAVTLLVFETGGPMPSAVPLESVARLEEFRQDQIESSQFGQVIQYRGEIMPLVAMGGGMQCGESDSVHVIVVTLEGRNVGVIVGKIVDTIETREPIASGQKQIVLQDRVTELVDLVDLARSSFPELASFDSYQ